VNTGGPLRLREMSRVQLKEAFARKPWLIVPVGSCEHHGDHLPLGCDSIVVERLADDLSAGLGVVRSPTVEFGVNDLGDVPGAASVRRKTLRRWLNDLLIDWERQGIEEFLILTMNGHAAHQEALGTVVTEQARVRVVDILALDLSSFVETPRDPIHGGEADTSLVLYVAPHLVDMTRAQDFILPDEALRRYRRGSSLGLAGNSGSVGLASLASAEKGRRIYEHILGRIRERVFGVNLSAVPG
jgi:creatinine amidohydrolase